MEHNVSLITTIAAAFGLSLILGLIAVRLKLPALVGYLLAGIIIGPATPGYVADMHIASQLSEIGVMLLMFGVGLHFSVKDLMSVKNIAIPGAVVQMSLATLLGFFVARSWDWSFGEALVFGLCLSCASTVVLLKALEAKGILASRNGQIAVGWLVVEDLATVLVLVLLPPLATLLGGTAPTGADAGPLWWTITQTLLQVVAFVVLMLVVGRKVFPWLLWQVASTGSRELFTLAVIAGAISIAYGASVLFHVSFALGAFFAGMVIRESEFSHRAAEESLPLRDAFSVLFFAAVGMLFEPAVLIEQPLHVLIVLAIIVLGKFLAALVLVLLFRYPLNSALTVAASLAQIGEFSFILAGLGMTLGLLPAQGMSLILAGALLSIALNPLVFAMVSPLNKWVLKRSQLARRLDSRADPFSELPMDTDRKYLENQVVLVGYGRVGRRIAAGLTKQGIPFVVADKNHDRVEQLRQTGVPAVFGDATDVDVLIQAHILHAAVLVIATPETIDVRKTVHSARLVNPAIQVILRTHNEDEVALLEKEQLGQVFLGEDELAHSMIAATMLHFKPAIVAEH
ncbi:Kef family K(+) transporter [Rheinheimera riviphila]|uniref:Kef family K(+) transporter n=1 Tax=Rheinheimera riviphila TaxID=1834037 RepID=A0A437R1E9_9GAMM|nr:YbaL family putative K(+) efflux transporter [Rheinheimera riviphila]RVU40614.1 Kef family K(+) transporter [Rheinheimera riviphila]